MKTSYFTFGWGQTHDFGGLTLDKDIVVKITAEDPRAKMFELFGDKWFTDYPSVEAVNMSFYPRGIYDINKGEFVDE